MTLDEVSFLLSSQYSKVAERVRSMVPDSFVVEREMLRLHKKNIPFLSTVLTQISLQKKAQDKFPEAECLLLSKDGVEQATRKELAAYVAERYQSYESRMDLTAGIGGDSREILSGAKLAVAVERDPVIAMMIRHNLNQWNLSEVEVRQEDAQETEIIEGAALYCDPMRRDSMGRRTSQISLWEPNPLACLPHWLQNACGVGIKVSPAFDYAELSASGLSPEVEMIGWGRDLKQAMWWIGDLQDSEITRRATLLPSRWTLTDQDDVQDVEIREPRGYIVEPHTAILRAELADQFCTRYGLAKIDEHIGYFTTDEVPEFEDPMIARVYRVMDLAKYNVRNLKRCLKTFHIDAATIRRRGFPHHPDDVRKKLKIEEGSEFTILLTRIGPSLYSIITERIDLQNESEG